MSSFWSFETDCEVLEYGEFDVFDQAGHGPGNYPVALCPLQGNDEASDSEREG